MGLDSGFGITVHGAELLAAANSAESSMICFLPQAPQGHTIWDTGARKGPMFGYMGGSS